MTDLLTWRMRIGSSKVTCRHWPHPYSEQRVCTQRRVSEQVPIISRTQHFEHVDPHASTPQSYQNEKPGDNL